MADLTVSPGKEKKTDATGTQMKTDFSATPPSFLNPTLSNYQSSGNSARGSSFWKPPTIFRCVDPRQQEALFAPAPPIGTPPPLSRVEWVADRAAAATIVRRGETNWQANLNFALFFTFSSFNVVAKVIRRGRRYTDMLRMRYANVETPNEKRPSASVLPAKDSAEERGVEAFGRREASLDFSDCHLVLGRGRKERQAAGHRAEHVRRGNWARQQHIFCFDCLL